ncbi:RDD family protein [Ostreibacterium oceani]|uniref:RDD family protein n=1 Tax=Ostreibacterium oceani TaxID=2654998 RepID=A0A6N7ESQ4_9GAMM|nr:RDD family protein [Ostreibacterium oceani]MPV85532.1 RDD family protein [Ostreibacterium oceani]
MKKNTNTVRLSRRLGAAFYDWILCFACLMLFTGLVVTINRGEFVSGRQSLFFQLALFSLVLFYFVGFWSHGGQTPGMKVWKIRLMADTPPASLNKLLLRFFVVLLTFGVAFFWAVFRSDHKGIHDIISKTTLWRE